MHNSSQKPQQKHPQKKLTLKAAETNSTKPTTQMHDLKEEEALISQYSSSFGVYYN
jgi:hypothetical protein